MRDLINIVEERSSADPAAPLARQSGTERRQDILLRARAGIRLQAEGGQAYDQDMRRLTKAGLVKIERRGSRNHFVSYLVLTDAGRAQLRAQGLDPAASPREPPPEDVWSDAFSAWHKRNQGL